MTLRFINCEIASQSFPADTVIEPFLFEVTDGASFNFSQSTNNNAVSVDVPPGTYTATVTRNGVVKSTTFVQDAPLPPPITINVPASISVG